MAVPCITIRDAIPEDAERLFTWRNDPITRKNSGSTDLVAWEDHRRWFEASLANPHRRLCVLEVDGEPAATCRFDFGDPTMFSFSIAPEFRGRGRLSLDLLRVAVEAEPDHVSHVKRSNIVIQRLLEAAGVRLIEDGELQTWRYSASLASGAGAD